MSGSPAFLSSAAIVTRLRTAGCVFAEDEARMLISAARTAAELATMVERRAAGLPLEHVVGWAEFCGLRVAVDPGVFVPRRRTEFLVTQTLTLARRSMDADPAVLAHQVAGPRDRAVPGDAPDHGLSAPIGGANRVDSDRGVRGSADQDDSAAPRAENRRPVVVDLCCGSGAVGAAVIAGLDGVELHAVDIDPAAVRCARRNLAAAGQVYEGDLYAPLPASLRGRVDVLVASAPYVPTEEIGLLPAEARVHEPRVALDGGADGLDVVRRVTAAAPRWLAPGGHLLVETSEHQAAETARAITRDGLVARVARCDELNATVVIGAWSAPG
ncbi:putative protein N(5)-glutamine methyltransferase [Nonomuraea sp. NPDC048916]|uniref:putative protein N(5)-glutamine methyltransferase n=1 Tax=Nonomuraea sp. NPDC048916 TaxID=3154232 RepID=UPI0033D91C4E